MAAKKAPAKVRGVYEREQGSGIWWIRYEVEGKPKREKVGRRSDAIALYQKRKADLRIGLKLPDNLRQRPVSVGELGRDAIQWYKDHSKRDVYTFSNRMELIIRELGDRSADKVILYFHGRYVLILQNGHFLSLNQAAVLPCQHSKAI